MGSTQYSGPFQPPVGNQPKPRLNTITSRMAATKLGVQMPSTLTKVAV